MNFGKVFYGFLDTLKSLADRGTVVDGPIDAMNGHVRSGIIQRNLSPIQRQAYLNFLEKHPQMKRDDITGIMRAYETGEQVSSDRGYDNGNISFLI